MNRLVFVILLLVLMLAGLFTRAEGTRRFVMPPEGVVVNEHMATAIAEIVLSNIYGADHIKMQKPFNASLSVDGVWTVVGTLPNREYVYGGVAMIKIRKLDGAILGLIHTK